MSTHITCAYSLLHNLLVFKNNFIRSTTLYICLELKIYLYSSLTVHVKLLKLRLCLTKYELEWDYWVSKYLITVNIYFIHGEFFLEAKYLDLRFAIVSSVEYFKFFHKIFYQTNIIVLWFNNVNFLHIEYLVGQEWTIPEVKYLPIVREKMQNK